MARARMMKEDRRPTFFESAGEPLYGCYHLPAGPKRELGVVLCQPFGQEYLRAHRAFVQLGARLAGRGFPVLRFDYFACGDSAGETEEGTVERWTADIAAASTRLRIATGVRRVGLVGLRLGGSLAVLSDADAEALVLWDPVVDGRRYIEELRAMHAEMLRYSYVDAQLSLAAGAEREEVLGFPLTVRQRMGVEAIDLLGLADPPAGRVLLIETDSAQPTARLREHLATMPIQVEHLGMAERKVWLAEPLQGIVPVKLIENVVNWFEAGSS